MKGWSLALAVGALVLVMGTAAGQAMGVFPSALDRCLPAAAALEFLRYFMVAVTIIVVAVPEGLAMSVTLSLAYSMRKMASTKVLVRKMHACETMGATTVICSDKTGTLTTNQMAVREVEAPSLLSPGPLAPLSPLALCLAVNSTAHLAEGSADSQPTQAVGNSTEGALLAWLRDQGIDYLPLRRAVTVHKQWLFSPVRKSMATLCSLPTADTDTLLREPVPRDVAQARGPVPQRNQGDPREGSTQGDPPRVLLLKGAPEWLLERCTHEWGPQGRRPLADRHGLQQRLEQCQARGRRTIGLAWRDVSANPATSASPEATDPATTASPQAAGVDGSEEALDSLAQGLTWVGFMALHDPVRPEVPEALAACLQAGIAVKMVTGDSPRTSLEVAREIGLLPTGEEPGAILTGREFEALDDEAAGQAASHLKILARARPLDKLRLVRLLQGQGHVVAVTGDGANDAPALKQAHVGLAMGVAGTAVAREASDVILLDDSFASVRQSVLWGRSLYQNIQRFILFQLTVNVAALAIALLGPFIGIKLPLTVTQMLWINLIMDTFAALALATEPPHAQVMQHPPRNRRAFIVTPPMQANILAAGSLFVAVLAAGLVIIRWDGVATPHELSVFFTVFVMLQFWNLFNARCLGLTQPAMSGIAENRGFILIATTILVGQFLAVQHGGVLFRLTPLSLGDWLVIVAGTSVVLWAGEFIRWRARHGQPAPPPEGLEK